MAQFFDNGYHRLIFLQYGLFVIFTVCAFIGYFIRTKSISIYEIFIPFYLSVVILWPTPEGFRFLIPIVPLFIFYFFLGIHQISTFISKHYTQFSSIKLEKVLVTALLMLSFLAYTLKYTTCDFRSIKEGINKKETKELFNYITNHTEATNIFMYKKPRILSLFTGRKASAYFQSPDDRDLWNYLNRIGATHLIIEPIGPPFLLSFVQKYDKYLKKIYSNNDFILFQIVTYISEEP